MQNGIENKKYKGRKYVRMYEIIIIVVTIAVGVIYFSKKPYILSLPSFFTFGIALIYSIIEKNILLQTLSGQEANELRMIIYMIIAILMMAINLFLSKRLEEKKEKMTYTITATVFNIAILFEIWYMTVLA